MQLDSTSPEDSVLVSALPGIIRELKAELGIVVDIVDIPSTSSSEGLPGNFALDSTYLYVYTGDGVVHQWRRTGLLTW